MHHLVEREPHLRGPAARARAGRAAGRAAALLLVLVLRERHHALEDAREHELEDRLEHVAAVVLVRRVRDERLRLGLADERDAPRQRPQQHAARRRLAALLCGEALLRLDANRRKSFPELRSASGVLTFMIPRTV